MLVGAEAPPIRLSIIKTARHPDFCAEQCTHPSCKFNDCKGNRFELTVEGEGTKVQLKAPHHKNVFRGFTAIEFDFPTGTESSDQFGRLMSLHVNEGHKVLAVGRRFAASSGGSSCMLFLSGAGIGFSDSTFTAYWHSILKKYGAAHSYPPALARTIFVESYTGKQGDSSGDSNDRPL